MKKCPPRRLVLGSALLVFSFSLSGCRPPDPGDGRILLAVGGKPRAVIVAGPEDRVAALSLQSHIKREAGAEPEIVVPGEESGRRERCAILVGTPRSNSAVALAIKEQGLSVDQAGLGDEGYILKTVAGPKRHRIIAAGTEKRGVFYAVGELKNYYLRHEGTALYALAADVREVPAFKYRWLWTWDWRMEWGGTEAGGSTMGEGDYKKKPESFIRDYKACIDFMSENGLNGLVIWGFLRDAHGGVAASQEICRYANERGVRILPGIGTSGYRGYYFEGDHEFNAPTWVRRHPELESRVVYDGKFVPGCPCPSKPENKQWLANGARWLFENFEIGGVNLEMGDFFVCPCPDCRRARAAIAPDEPDYYKDMAICLRELLPVMREAAPDAWLSYATYTGFNREMMARPPKFIELIPEDAICQWTVTGMMGDKDIPDPMTSLKDWPAGLKPMAKHNIGYLHWANKSTSTENDLFLRRFQAAAANSARSGLEGLAFYGELGDGAPNMSLNYLAFKEFCFHPEMTVEEFTVRRLAPLYGADQAAALWRVVDGISGLPKAEMGGAAKAALAVVDETAPGAPAHTQGNWRKLRDFLAGIQ
jgi:hypothetical protein